MPTNATIINTWHDLQVYDMTVTVGTDRPLKSYAKSLTSTSSPFPSAKLSSYSYSQCLWSRESSQNLDTCTFVVECCFLPTSFKLQFNESFTTFPCCFTHTLYVYLYVYSTGSLIRCPPECNYGRLKAHTCTLIPIAFHITIIFFLTIWPWWLLVM